MGILTLIIFLPLLGIPLILALPNSAADFRRWICAGISLIQLIICAILFFNFQAAETTEIASISSYQYVESIPWISLKLGQFGNFTTTYLIGIDGISLLMLSISSLVLFLASIASNEIKTMTKGYFSLFLLLNTAIMGVFCSLDLFLFYIFYEFMLLPLYFLVGIWGGMNRKFAAIKFFLYTFIGSVFMLLVILGLYFSYASPETGEYTFNILYLMDSANIIPDSLLSVNSLAAEIWGKSARLIAFVTLFIAFAIKVPIVPFHTWLPDAHVEAPTPISMILAGILLKVGAYGIIRICYGIFPEMALHLAFPIGIIGVISIIYGGLNALAQKDLKRMIAYSSVSHMGFVILGIASLTAEGLNGAIYQMVSHGILSPMLFFCVGIIYVRTKERNIDAFKGLNSVMPKFTFFVGLAFFASLGLPGFSGFIGEMLTLLGAFISDGVNSLLPRWMAMVSILGILLGAGYFLWTFQRMFLGPFWIKNSEWKEKLQDLKAVEWVVLTPLALLTLVLGIVPNLIFSLSENAVFSLIENIMSEGRENLNMMNYLFKW